jgi:hypothetical protein
MGFHKIQNMLGDGLRGYYAILSQLYEGCSGGTLAPHINKDEIRIKARNDAFTLKENIVKPYLTELNINWKRRRKIVFV